VRTERIGNWAVHGRLGLATSLSETCSSDGEQSVSLREQTG
jgi:hypothetical protein